jgi:hypothetical protein
MTNTLHRRGKTESLKGDFVVFATPSRSMSPELPDKMRRFTELCLKYKPVNVGRFENMALRRVDSRNIEKEMEGEIALTATFDNLEAVASLVDDLKAADLGVPINISGLLQEVRQCCKKVGLERHSVEQSLGIFGRKDRLPPREIVEMNTMCGHGMVSFNLIKKILEEVKAGRMTVQDGAYHLAKPCECGAFNPTRAKELLENLRMKG